MLCLHVHQSASASRYCAPLCPNVPIRTVPPLRRYLPAWKAAPRPEWSAAATNSTHAEQPLAQDELTAIQTIAAAPSKRHQPQPTGKERAAMRAYSETLAKDKKLQRLQFGAQGITYNVLMACLDILVKHEYLRVKLGEGCGLERKQTAAMLANLLDAVVVGQVGFTITLYRQKGLPRPDNLTKVAGS